MKLFFFILLLAGIAVLFCMPMTSDFLDKSPESLVPEGKPSQMSNSPSSNNTQK